MNIPDGEVWIIDRADPRRSVRLYNIDTEPQYYELENPSDGHPDVEQTHWQKFSWSLVLGIILFPFLLGLLFFGLWIIFSLTS